MKPGKPLPDSQQTAELFRHVSAEKAPAYRAILQTFAAAKRQFRLHLRPDEVRADTHWPGAAPDAGAPTTPKC